MVGSSVLAMYITCSPRPQTRARKSLCNLRTLKSRRVNLTRRLRDDGSFLRIFGVKFTLFNLGTNLRLAG